MSERGPQIGRLAMRHEGEWWNAYYAMPDTMEGAIQLGSIRITAVDRPDRKTAFMQCMREVVADIIEEKIGVRPVWGGAHAAPERERSGHG